MRHQHAVRRFAVAVLLGLALVGCGGQDDAGDSAAPEAAQDADSDADRGGAAEGLAEGAPAAGPREVIYTADLVVRAGDVLAAADQAETIVTEAGGFVLSADRGREPRTRANLVVRVPADDLADTLAALGELGDVRSESLVADDVTAQVIDLQTRVASAETSIARLQDLLAQAGSVEALVQIESTLANRQSELESALAQLQGLEDQVALSTINLTLLEPGDPQISDDVPGFLRGLRGGVVALVNFLQWVVTLIGAVLPFALLFGLLGYGVMRLRRWRDARRPPPPTPPPAPRLPGPPDPGSQVSALE